MPFIKIQDSEIYYEIKGKGTPVVMIHGWSMDHRLMSGCMEAVFERIPMPYQRIYFDLPGMGHSKAGESVKTSVQVLDVIYEFLSNVIGKQPYLLVGESYGGYLARAMVKKHQEQILGLLLICPLIIPGYRKGRTEKLEILENDEELLSSLNDEERACFESITVLRTREVWEMFKEEVYAALQIKNHHFLNEVLQGELPYDVDALEEPYNKPCLIMTGRQDSEVGIKDQFALLNKYPMASYVALNRAGHNLQIEQREFFRCIVEHWLLDNFS